MFKHYGSVRLLLFSLLLTFALKAQAAQPAKAPVGLPNFAQVAPGIYRGGAPTPAGLKSLQALSIHTIIDLRIERALAKAEKKSAEAMGFTWINLPMGKEAPTQRQVDTFLAALAKAPQTPVYVHCQHGADRTGCMIGIYRIQVQGWSFAQAWPEMRKYGFKPYLGELKGAVSSRTQAR